MKFSALSVGQMEALKNRKSAGRPLEGGHYVGEVINIEDAEYKDDYKFTSDGQERTVECLYDAKNERLLVSFRAITGKSNKFEKKSVLMEKIWATNNDYEVLEILKDVKAIKCIETVTTTSRFGERTLCLWEVA